MAVWTRFAMGPIDVNVTRHNPAMAVLDKPFGLRSATVADITVRWPDGTATELEDIDADQTITIAQGQFGPPPT